MVTLCEQGSSLKVTTLTEYIFPTDNSRAKLWFCQNTQLTFKTTNRTYLSFHKSFEKPHFLGHNRMFLSPVSLSHMEQSMWRSGSVSTSHQQQDALPVNEGALSCRVVTHYHHNDLLSGRQEPDPKAVGNFYEAWKHMFTQSSQGTQQLKRCLCSEMLKTGFIIKNNVLL